MSAYQEELEVHEIEKDKARGVMKELRESSSVLTNPLFCHIYVYIKLPLSKQKCGFHW